MIQKIQLENILFLDIETVPEHPEYDQLSEIQQELWAAKTAYQRKEDYSPEEFYNRAGIWAEFGKIVCISVGYFNPSADRNFRVTTFFGAESQLLKEFNNLLESHFNKPYQLLCAHNGKEFDFPYIARRCVINGIDLPSKLNLFGKKPWEIPHIDTMDMWKFGDYKHYTSLKLLTNILGIPSPKDDIDGSMVYKVYYEEENGIDRIITYCEKDVIATAQVLLRFKNLPLLEVHEIKHV
jgi:uncharacterized protein YprB with RNaseH-like and TPR domain